MGCISQADGISVKSSNKTIKNEITREEAEFFDLTNKERAHAGLRPLEINMSLMNAARDHSADMARNQKLSHTIKGKSLTYRIKETGYIYIAAGENAAYAKGCPDHILKLWMQSPRHRKNILNPQYEEVGLGVSRTPDGYKYFTQIFATQK
jgi:uncharacterized protein YkwD